MNIKCAECQCVPHCCANASKDKQCILCTKDVCCCITIHSNVTKPHLIKESAVTSTDDCCSTGVCKDETSKNTNHSQPAYGIRQFFRNVKRLYAAALGIEILCITAAEIGENFGFYIFGLNHIGIPIAYAMGYALAGFTTFAAILGRYKYNEKIDSCCSVLDQNSKKGFVVNLVSTFKDFTAGLKKIPQLHGQKDLKKILKTSTRILITAESACILTAETVDLVFYKSSMFLSVPLALLVGAFTVVVIEAYKMRKH